MEKSVGLIAASFALGEKEPNPCNVRLAQGVARIIVNEETKVIPVVQWEIAAALVQSKVPLIHVVKQHRNPDTYLDTEEVVAQAVPIFEQHFITEVIPVANPFLHLHKLKCLIESYGFTVLEREIGYIGFYRDSLQWWTRGPTRLLTYAVLQKSFGYRGSVTSRAPDS